MNRVKQDQLQYELLQQLGSCYDAAGDAVQAKRCFEQAASAGPDEPGPYVGLGNLALQNDDLEQAKLSFRVAVRLSPGCAAGYAGLAAVAQKEGDCRGAFGFYLKCLENDRDNLKALLGLFQASCEMGSFGEITRYLELYLDSHRADTAVMFTLAALYMKDDKVEEATDILEELLEIDPGNEQAAALFEELRQCRLAV